jgi:hypothetical protein
VVDHEVADADRADLPVGQELLERAVRGDLLGRRKVFVGGLAVYPGIIDLESALGPLMG